MRAMARSQAARAITPSHVTVDRGAAQADDMYGELSYGPGPRDTSVVRWTWVSQLQDFSPTRSPSGEPNRRDIPHITSRRLAGTTT